MHHTLQRANRTIQVQSPESDSLVIASLYPLNVQEQQGMLGQSLQSCWPAYSATRNGVVISKKSH